MWASASAALPAPARSIRCWLQSSFDLPKRIHFRSDYRYVSALPGLGDPAYSTADARLGWSLGHASGTFGCRQKPPSAAITSSSRAIPDRMWRSREMFYGKVGLEKQGKLTTVTPLFDSVWSHGPPPNPRCFSGVRFVRCSLILLAGCACVLFAVQPRAAVQAAGISSKSRLSVQFRQIRRMARVGGEGRTHSRFACWDTIPLGRLWTRRSPEKRSEPKTLSRGELPMPSDAADCRILFISSSEAAPLKEILAVCGKIQRSDGQRLARLSRTAAA